MTHQQFHLHKVNIINRRSQTKQNFLHKTNFKMYIESQTRLLGIDPVFLNLELISSLDIYEEYLSQW